MTSRPRRRPVLLLRRHCTPCLLVAPKPLQWDEEVRAPRKHQVTACNIRADDEGRDLKGLETEHALVSLQSLSQFSKEWGTFRSGSHPRSTASVSPATPREASCRCQSPSVDEFGPGTWGRAWLRLSAGSPLYLSTQKLLTPATVLRLVNETPRCTAGTARYRNAEDIRR